MPKISVIIISYNHEKFIKENFASFLSQTFQDFEIILADDCSKDKSQEVIKSLESEKISHKILLQENIGFCDIANLALEKAKGEYVHLIAADDVVEKGFLQKEFEFLEKNSEYDCVFSKISVIDEKSQILDKKTERFDKYFLHKNYNPAQFLNHFFYKGNFLSAPTFMIKTEILKEIGGFDSRFAQIQDLDLWVRLCVKGCKMHILPERLLRYRRMGDNNLSSNTDLTRIRSVFDREKILNRFLEIKNIDFFNEIFYNSKKELNAKLIPFYLAKEALNVDTIHHQQFAISVLFDILKDKEIVEILEKEENFKISRDFYKIVAKNPLGVLNKFKNKKPFVKRFIKNFGNKIKNIFK